MSTPPTSSGTPNPARRTRRRGDISSHVGLVSLVIYNRVGEGDVGLLILERNVGFYRSDWLPRRNQGPLEKHGEREPLRAELSPCCYDEAPQFNLTLPRSVPRTARTDRQFSFGYGEERLWRFLDAEKRGNATCSDL
uniref:Uncharacterized protein n=1 Tax=Tenebrio molitor TaxID=7067 RepID=A0A8J6H577_TENMO|nr:hypothetical protein GEV33_014684 [Tenebrio molitor]